MEEMSNKFVARQAIFDHQKNTYAYELLFRNNNENIDVQPKPEQATSQVILQNHIFGDLNNLCSQKKAFINFDEQSLLKEIPLVLDRNTVILELLETINVTPDVIKVVSSLYHKGYTLALDDYDFSPKWEKLFPYISIIKVDREDISFEQIVALKNSQFVSDKNIKIVVERIETHEQFKMLIQIGIDYFQGYFFHKPELNVGHFIKPIKLNLLQLFAEVFKSDLDFNNLSEIISQDVSLMSGVLKLVNLETEKNRVEISSIKQAVTYLGADKIKQFIAIIAMSNLSSGSNSELLRESLVRGKMMEYISFSPAFLNIRGLAFITGVMSHIGAILNCSTEEIIMELPLAEEIKMALVAKKGMLYDALEIVKYYEFSEDKKENCSIMAKYDISEEALLMFYHDALKWCCATCP